MTQQILSQSIEYPDTISRAGYAAKNIVLKYKKEAEKSNIRLNLRLVNEWQEYIKRNILVDVGRFPKAPLRKSFCSQCFKAHALLHAQKQGVKADEVERLSEIFPGSAGHDGYYLDGEELVKFE